MFNFLGELVGSKVGKAFGQAFEGGLRQLDRPRTYVVLVLLAAVGGCVATVYSQPGGLLRLVPLAIGMLVLLAVFGVARLIVARLPDQPAPSSPPEPEADVALPESPTPTPFTLVMLAVFGVARLMSARLPDPPAPPSPPEPETDVALPELPTPVHPVHFDFSSPQLLTPELRRHRRWFYGLCALAGLAGQMAVFLLLTTVLSDWVWGFAKISVEPVSQNLCGIPFGLMAGLLVSILMAPFTDVEKTRLLENPTRWERGLAVSFVAGLALAVPAYLFLFIGGSM